LDVGNTDLDVDSVIAFATVLTANTTIKALNLDRPLLRSKQVALPPGLAAHAQEEATGHISHMLAINHNLTSLSLRKVLNQTTCSPSQHSISDHGASLIAEGLLQNSTLLNLDLSWYSGLSRL
jgi:hypothetical protein